jgi:putative phosphoesterase
MKIAVLGDVHGNFDALEAVLKDMRNAQTDALIVLGDILFYGDEPQRCVDVISHLNPLAWIRGNTDNWLIEIGYDFSPQSVKEERILNEYKRVLPLLSDEAREKIISLNVKEDISIWDKSLLCVHGSDRRANEAIGIMSSEEDLQALAERIHADIFLCAHTHVPFTASINGKAIINVGSVGLPADGTNACWCMLRFEGDNFGYEIRRVKY